MSVYSPQGGGQRPNAETHPRAECGADAAKAVAVTHVGSWVECLVMHMEITDKEWSWVSENLVCYELVGAKEDRVWRKR